MFTLDRRLRTSTGVMFAIVAALPTAAAQPIPEPNPDGGDPQWPETPPDPTSPDDVTNDDDPTVPRGDVPAPVDPQPRVEPLPERDPTPTNVSERTYAPRESALERYGIGLSLGGGVSGFTGDTLRATTDDGGTWGARLSLGTRLPVGVEVAYVGSAQSIDALGLDSSSILVANGVEGVLRLNLLENNAQPFVFVGLGWRRYSLVNSDENTSDVSERDDVLEVPMGAGVAWTYSGLLLDARGEFRYADQEDLVPDITASGARDGSGAMHRYGVNVNVGVAF